MPLLRWLVETPLLCWLCMLCTLNGLATSLPLVLCDLGDWESVDSRFPVLCVACDSTDLVLDRECVCVCEWGVAAEDMLALVPREGRRNWKG